MGLPALRVQPRTRTRGPHLRLVAPARPQKHRRSRAAQAAIARHNFRMFVALLAVLATLGIGRVWLTVQATEASLAANQLRSEIKTERYEGDMLEVRQSALGSPSRIRAIAGRAMDMAPAEEVTYLDLTKASRRTATRAGSARARTDGAAVAASANSGLEGALAAILDLTAGEAQVLLVGDVGLSSSK